MPRSAIPGPPANDRGAYRDFLRDVLTEFRKVGQALNDLHERVGRVESSLGNIAEKQSMAAGHDHRLTVIEERLTGLTADMARQVDYKRWLVGIIVALAGMVLTDLAPHLRWR
jgi:hypothetical protein